MKQLAHRTAVVTGAGSGIGRETSILLAREGCRLALVDVDESGLQETRGLVEKAGQPASVHVVDVSDKARMQALPNEVIRAHGAVHVLVNNAGVSVSATFLNHSIEDFEWLMGINFWGVVYGCKFFLPHLLRQDEAHIVNLSSLFGLAGVPRQTSYCASKFAVRGFSEALRMELQGSPVGVTNVHPGGIATNIAASTRFNGDAREQAIHQRTIRTFKKMVPASVAAARIVDGIKHNRRRVLITREAHVVDVARRIAPAASEALLQWGYKRFSGGGR